MDYHNLPFDIQSVAFCPDCFFNPEFFFWLDFCISFSENVPKVSSLLISLITYIHGTICFILLITKASLEQFGVTFWKNILVFWYSHMITNFEFRIFIVMLYSVHVPDLTSTVFWFFYDICWCICQLFSSSLSMYTFFNTTIICL